MDSFMKDLKGRFDYSVIFFESLWEHDPNGMLDDRTVRPHTEEEARMIDIFERLSATVETIPSDILREAEELRAKMPDVFEQILFSLINYVGAKYTAGGYFEPTSAGEFVEKLIEYIRLRVTNPSLFDPIVGDALYSSSDVDAVRPDPQR